MLYLRLIQKKADTEYSTLLPEEGTFTIGRHGVVPTLVGGAAISRIHATVSREAAGWLVRDGGEVQGLWKASSFGIYDVNGERCEECELKSDGDWIDLLAPQDNVLVRILCQQITTDSTEARDFSRETQPFGEYWHHELLDKFEAMTAETKACQTRQEQHITALELKISSLQKDIFNFHRACQRENKRQDSLIKGLAAALLIMAMSLVVDPVGRGKYVDTIVTIVLAGVAGVGTMAVSGHKKDAD